MSRVCVLGAGAFGLAAAAHLTIEGHEVSLLGRPTEWDSARLIAPFLQDGQLVLVNRGLCGVALRLSHVLVATRCSVRILVAETSAQAYLAREVTPNGPGAAGAMTPPPGAPATVDVELVPRRALLYPPVVLLNAGRIQGGDGGNFALFGDGVTPAVAEIMHAADVERMTLLRSLGFGAAGLLERLSHEGYASGDVVARQSFYEAFREAGPLGGVRAPASLDDDNLHDGIACGLVPMVEIGRLLGIQSPVMDSLATLGSLATGRSYQTVGLTSDQMGLPAEVWKLDPSWSRGWDSPVAGAAGGVGLHEPARPPAATKPRDRRSAGPGRPRPPTW